jgi:hypothetical protein
VKHYQYAEGMVDLAVAVVRQAVRDLEAGRRYVRAEMDPGDWLAQAGMLHLAEQALAAKEQRR